MSEIQILTTLRNELITFFDQLIDLMPAEGDLIIIRFFIADKYPITDIMDYIIEKLLPLIDLVKNKNDNFFLQNNVLFDKLDDKKVNYFKNLWLSDVLDSDDKEIIWKWFRRILLRAEQYSKITKK